MNKAILFGLCMFLLMGCNPEPNSGIIFNEDSYTATTIDVNDMIKTLESGKPFRLENETHPGDLYQCYKVNSTK